MRWRRSRPGGGRVTSAGSTRCAAFGRRIRKRAMLPLAGGKERRRSVGAHRIARRGGAVRGASPSHGCLFIAVVVVVVVVSRGARARDEREHEGKEKNADGGETSGRHGSVECVRARGGLWQTQCTTRFLQKRCRPVQSEQRAESAPPPKIDDADRTVYNPKVRAINLWRDISATFRFWSVSRFSLVSDRPDPQCHYCHRTRKRNERRS